MWNFANVFEPIAAAIPDRPAQIRGERVVSWGEFDRRANALARFMDHVQRHDKAWVCRRVEIARHWMAKHPAPSA